MNQVLLHPGERGAIALHLENRSDRPLRWSLQIKGDFPPEWCHWPEPDAPLVPGQKGESAIQFWVPADFFESPFAETHALPLKLNYQSEVLVYVATGNDGDAALSPQLVSYQVFTLHIRPRSPYLHFMPALYRENDWIGRFLAIIEQAFDPTVQTMDQLWAYLDPLTAPESLLPFLAHWVGWTTDAHWPIHQQRRLIRNAVTLYRWHGTRRGLRYYLHLYTGLPLDDDPAIPESEKHISIEEVFNDGFVLGRTTIAQDSMLGGGKPYHFVVRLRLEHPPGNQQPPLNEILIRAIIDQQKPAFCTYDLHIMPSN